VKALSWLTNRNQGLDGSAYWRKRVKKHGKRSVLNLAHPDSEFDEVTEGQKKLLFPLLSNLLRGPEKSVLDFGCGPGRFTSDLANLVGGQAVGLDISQDLIRIAPLADNVSYRVMADSGIPAYDLKFDVIWVCLVLGVIPEPAIKAKAEALEQLLSPGGLLFLVENTSQKPDLDYMFFRSVSQYQAMFPSVALQALSSYSDVGEEISILAGRKREC
jgi:SAM-dependent methyltransferase